jgi:hypothetical protein
MSFMSTADTTERLERLERWAEAVNDALDVLTSVERRVENHRDALEHHGTALRALEGSTADALAIVENHEHALTLLARIVLGARIDEEGSS